MLLLCLWDNRAGDEHYILQNWIAQHEWTPGNKKLEHVPLAPPKIIILPQLHSKLKIFKDFLKSRDGEEQPIKLLKPVFPRLSDTKIKEGVCWTRGSQIDEE